MSFKLFLTCSALNFTLITIEPPNNYAWRSTFMKFLQMPDVYIKISTCGALKRGVIKNFFKIFYKCLTLNPILICLTYPFWDSVFVGVCYAYNQFFIKIHFPKKFYLKIFQEDHKKVLIIFFTFYKGKIQKKIQKKNK